MYKLSGNGSLDPYPTKQTGSSENHRVKCAFTRRYLSGTGGHIFDKAFICQSYIAYFDPIGPIGSILEQRHLGKLGSHTI